MRLTEVISLAWTQIDMAALTLRIEDTKSGEPLEFPVTRQLATILERRLAERERFAVETQGWVFPSQTSASGHLESIQHLNARIGEAGRARFWFHALRNCFITVADRELMLPTGLTNRLVKHAPPPDVTQGYA
ncbi:MAG: tyrosine-type recombinase/integrase, partial [Rhodospirillales bacterium]|nr:tyrosine-type recombinase/integrase [Rhodospirillales bacterium]